MSTRARQSIFQALRWDLAVIVVVVGLYGLVDWLSETRVRPTQSDVSTGSRPPDRTEGDILLFLPDSPSAEANHIQELDCSYAWFNTLWQEQGSFATAMNRDLSPEILAGRTAVIVPARVARDMPTAGVDALAAFVSQGGQLLVERPSEAWASLASVYTSGNDRHAQRITSVEGLQLRGAVREELLELPLSGALTPAPEMDPFPDGPMLMEIDGQPGIVARQHGQGWVYTFLYNHGCVSASLQQGLPLPDTMKFAGTSASDRAADTKMLTSRVPLSDVLDRALLGRINAVRPMARFWYFPSTFAGAMVMTISATDDIGAGLAFADRARINDGVSTLYVAADRLAKAQVSIAEGSNAEVGLSWVRGVNRPLVTESVGIGGIRPVAYELDLNAQYTRLNLILPENKPLRMGRVEASQMTPDWSTTFQQMAHGRLRVSSTLGPTKAEEWGYVFGTGFPYYPLDRRGLPMPMMESPFVLQGGGISRERLETLLGDSASRFHQPVVVNLPSDVMLREPAAGVMLAFQDAFSLAHQYDHWVARHGELMDFLAARRRSVLTSQFDQERRRLSVSLNVLGSNATTLEKGAIPSVAFPKTYDGQDVATVSVDGEPVALKTLAGMTGEYVLEVGEGRHTVVVTYLEPQPLRIESLDP